MLHSWIITYKPDQRILWLLTLGIFWPLTIHDWRSSSSSIDHFRTNKTIEVIRSFAVVLTYTQHGSRVKYNITASYTYLPTTTAPSHFTWRINQHHWSKKSKPMSFKKYSHSFTHKLAHVVIYNHLGKETSNGHSLLTFFKLKIKREENNHGDDEFIRVHVLKRKPYRTPLSLSS